jgi:Flp pilus assembly protein TadD
MSQIEIFLKMIDNGQDSEMLRFTVGGAYFKEEKFEDAISHLRKAVELKPDYSAAWKMLGRSFAAAGDTENALEAYDQGLSVATANGDKQTAKEITVFRKRVIKALGQE